MTSVHYAPFPVQLAFDPSIAIIGLPERFRREPEPFHPSLADEAMDAGYRLARDGERPAPPAEYRADRDAALAFIVGANRGKLDRELAEARELGLALGLEGSGLVEPPAGLRESEKAAYRDGHAEGLAAYEFERDDWADAQVEEYDQMTEAFGSPITDADVYPMGCMS
jgi:hypothetical protein